jgi:hypothetical protein
MKRSIASNHLSSLASKGRFGDNEIAKTSEGELWHVNKREKDLISMYGKRGERMVDALGSGTINPETGLEEKFPWLVAAAVASTAIGAYGAASGAKQRKEQGEFDVEAGIEGFEQVEKTEEALERNVEAQKSAAFTDYSMAQENLSAKTGIAIEDLEKSTEKIVRRANMATTSSERENTMWDRIQKSHGLSEDSLTATFAKTMGKLEGDYIAEKDRLKMEKNKFARMINLGHKKQEGLFG